MRRILSYVKSQEGLIAIQGWAIIGSLLISAGALALTLWDRQVQAERISAELMLRFDERIHAGLSGKVAVALDWGTPLPREDGRVDETALDQFLLNYQLLDEAYDHGLLDKGMAEDAFRFELERAMNNRDVREFIAEARKAEKQPGLYFGVDELAAKFEITIPAARASAQPTASPMR